MSTKYFNDFLLKIIVYLRQHFMLLCGWYWYDFRPDRASLGAALSWGQPTKMEADAACTRHEFAAANGSNSPS
jgi:hypothetical protein